MYTDSQLLDMLRSQDTREVHQAQVQIYQNNLGKVIGKAIKQGFSPEEGQDFATDAMIALVMRCQKDPGFTPQSLDGYFVGVGYNLIVQAIKGRKVSRETLIEEAPSEKIEDTERTAADLLNMREQRDAVDDCLGQMTPRCQRKVILRQLPHREGLEKAMSWKEIAEMLDYANAKSAKSAFVACKKAFIACICKKYPSRCRQAA